MDSDSKSQKTINVLRGGVICAIMLDMEYRLSKDIAALL